MKRSIQRPVGRFIVVDECICHGQPTFAARAFWWRMFWNK
jgi:hypothetical protein